MSKNKSCTVVCFRRVRENLHALNIRSSYSKLLWLSVMVISFIAAWPLITIPLQLVETIGADNKGNEMGIFPTVRNKSFYIGRKYKIRCLVDTTCFPLTLNFENTWPVSRGVDNESRGKAGKDFNYVTKEERTGFSMMPASEMSSRRSSMAFTEVQKTAVNLLDPLAGRQRTYSASSSKHSTQLKSVTMTNPRVAQDVQTLAPRLANTYKMQPDEDKRFKCKDVTDIIDHVLEERLKGLSYDPDKCRFLLPSIADEIKEKVKQLGFDRFKLVCLVTIGELHNQGVRVASRCLWNTETDRLATSSFCKNDLFASAVVFGIYKE